MGCGNSLIALQTLLFLCFLCDVFIECDEIERRDVHRIILKGVRRPRSYKGHRHYHGHHSHKGHSHNPRGRDHSFENLYDSHSSESGHKNHGHNRPKGRNPKHIRDNREKHKGHSYEQYNDDFKEQSKSNENSFEEFYHGQSPYKLQNHKRPYLPPHSLEFDETRPEITHNDWTPVQYQDNNQHFYPPEKQIANKKKKNKPKKPKPYFKSSPLVEFTTAFPQKVPYLVYDNTEYPFLDASINRDFTGKNVELINAPVLNLDTIKTLTQEKSIPKDKRTSYKVAKNPANDIKDTNQHQYQVLVPDFTQTFFKSSESRINEEQIEPETTTEKVTTTRRTGRRRTRGRSQLKKQEAQ